MDVSAGGLLDPAWAGTGLDSLLDDRAVLAALVDTEIALARAQADLGVIPAAAAEAIAECADAEALDAPAVAAGVRVTANPIVGFVAQLATHVESHRPGIGDYVHRGSTSQDVLDTALMVLAHRALGAILADLDRVASALADLAVGHRDTPMAARTLTQQAVPTTFGVKVAGWRHGVLGARARVDRVRGELPVSVAGAAGTLAAYAEFARLAGVADPAGSALELPDRLAAHLGLAPQRFPWHGVRLPMLDLAAALAATTGVLGKVAADVLVMARTEVAEVSERAAPGRGGSSAMPQKQNPVYATLVATAARQLPPLAMVLMQSMVAEDERSSGAWHAEWGCLRQALAVTGGAAANAAELVTGLAVHPDAMLANLRRTGGAVTSERLGAVLADRLGTRAAKDLLAEATKVAGTTPGALAAEITARLGAGGHAVPADLDALVDPTRYTGVAGLLVDVQLRTEPAPESSSTQHDRQ